MNDIREFVETGARNAVVEQAGNKSIQSIQANYNVAIKRLGYRDIVGTMRREETLWLVRKDKKQ